MTTRTIHLHLSTHGRQKRRAVPAVTNCVPRIAVVGVTAAPKSALTQNLADREFCLILADFRKWPGDRRRLLPKERVPVGVEIVSFLAKTYREMLSDGAINSNRADLELDFKLPIPNMQRKLSQSESL